MITDGLTVKALTLMNLAGDGLPNPNPERPPGMQGIDDLLNWAQFLAFAVAIGGLIVAGAMLAINLRNGQGSDEGVMLTKPIIGALVISAAGAIIGILV